MREQLYEEIYRAELTHWWFRGRLRIVGTLIRHFAPPAQPLWVADIGCGMGAGFETLGEFGRVVGVDNSLKALEFSRSRGPHRLVAGALPALPFPDGAFDIVCALDVIEHLDDDRDAARELWRVCKPGGLLVVTVPACPWLWGEHDEINDHKRRYTRENLRACLAQLDGEWLRLSHMNTLLAPPLMIYRPLVRFCRRFVPRAEEPRSDIFDLPPTLNSLLTRLFGAESRWLKHRALPFGASLIAVQRKRLRLPAP
ncbi:MAG: class I SAM-dependent methyltransferase [Verrucomicrobiae bacterium]|nr:class I SAM-dependent methyltransferase [Verrucomicrobiae bacterium]